jgi:superoxide dismutase, Cu-Zn family
MKKAVIAASILAVSACASLEPAGPSAVATLRPASGTQVHGELKFTQVGANRVRVTGEVAGHTAGAKGIHIHEKGDCSAPDAKSAGTHFNPAKSHHGSSPVAGHTGDMGNIVFSDTGKANVDMVVEGLTVSTDAKNGIIGRAVIVHMQSDDLKTDPSGNSGDPAACGVIG